MMSAVDWKYLTGSVVIQPPPGKTITIIIPLPRKISTNKIYAGVHWSERYRHWKIFALHCALPFKKLKGKIKDYPVSLSFAFRFKGRALDASNCSYMAKLLEDALIKYGVIAGDSPKYVSSVTLSSAARGDDAVKIIIQGGE